MELIYIYYEDFVYLKKEEIYLNKNYEIEFDKINLNLLNINKFKPKCTIYPKNVLSLTTLVGKNGIGKSNILKSIVDISYFRNNKVFMVYYIKSEKNGVSEEKDYYRIVSYIDDFKINDEPVGYKYGTTKHIEVSNNHITIIEDTEQFKNDNINVSLISGYTFYTNFKDRIYSNTYSVEGMGDGLTVVGLIKTLQEVVKLPDLFNSEKYILEVDYSDISDFYYLGKFIERRKELFKHFKNNPYKDINLTKKLTVLNKIRRNIDEKIYANDDNMHDSEKLEMKQFEMICLYIETLLSIICVSMEKELNKFNDFINEINEIEIGESELLEDNISYLREIIHGIYTNTKIDVCINEDEFDKVIKYLGLNLFFGQMGARIEIPVSDENEEFIDAVEIFENKIIRTVYSAIVYQNYAYPGSHSKNIDKSITNRIFYLSSAEESYLNLYAYIRKEIEKNKDKKNMIILLDEPDKNMHPELAKNFLNTLFDVIKSYEDNDIKFMIVLATHSPFILSDVLSEDVVCLKRNEDNSVSVDKRDLKTFANNIQDILVNSFFLDSTVGDFAKKSINDAIDYLNNTERNIEKLNEIRFLIDNISEPIVKEYMNRLYNIKTNVIDTTAWTDEQKNKIYKELKSAREEKGEPL